MFRTNNQIKTKNNHTEITGNKQIISISNLIILILITKNIIVTKTLFDKMTLLNPTQTRFFHYSKKTQLKKSLKDQKRAENNLKMLNSSFKEDSKNLKEKLF